ncbi:MAG TPA: hypothetical protein VKQ70_16595 [Caulobacteraceae bacterium]|nr:hypothetical protein [Caulobacteraceae bacterium]
MTLIVVGRRGNELACLADTMLSSKADAMDAAGVPTAHGIQQITIGSEAYRASLALKIFPIARNACVLICGVQSSALAFVERLTRLCQGVVLTTQSFKQLCDQAAAGLRPDFGYLAPSQLDEGPDIHGPPSRIPPPIEYKGATFYALGTGYKDFSDFCRTVDQSYNIIGAPTTLRDFLLMFAAFAQGLQHMRGVGIAAKWGAAFEHLNNARGELLRENSIYTDVGLIRRGEDGRVKRLAETPTNSSMTWTSFQTYYRWNLLIAGLRPGNKGFDLYEAKQAPQMPGELEIAKNREGLAYRVETIVTLHKRYAPEGPDVVFDVQRFPLDRPQMSIALGGETSLILPDKERVAKEVIQPIMMRTAAALGV